MSRVIDLHVSKIAGNSIKITPTSQQSNQGSIDVAIGGSGGTTPGFCIGYVQVSATPASPPNSQEITLFIPVLA